MSNPYTKPSIANYNANPPPDDGSTGADNEITWAKHKTKLTDPIKDYVDSISNNVFSAFGKRAFNDVSSISSSYTVLAADEGKLLSCSNTITITLPAAASVGTGFMVSILNSGTGTVTVDGDGAETINGAATAAISAKQGATLVSDGSAWSAAFGAPSSVDFPPSGTIWGSENDGAGSGLDADTLDGHEASAFPKVHTGTWTTATLSAGASEETTITHGLGTDDVFVLLMGEYNGLTAGDYVSWSASAIRPDEKQFVAKAPSTFPGSAPSSGDITIRATNEHASTSTSVSIAYMIFAP